jgi:tryptophanase
MLGIIACNYDKTFEELYAAMQAGFKDTVFEELPKEMVAQCVIKLLVDGMIEMSGEVKFKDKTVEDVVNMLLNGEMADRKFRITKKV